MRKQRPNSFIMFKVKTLRPASSFNSLAHNQLMNLASSDGSDSSKITKKKVQKSKSDISVRKKSEVIKKTTTIEIKQIFVNPLPNDRESKSKKSHRRKKRNKKKSKKSKKTTSSSSPVNFAINSSSSSSFSSLSSRKKKKKTPRNLNTDPSHQFSTNGLSFKDFKQFDLICVEKPTFYFSNEQISSQIASYHLIGKEKDVMTPDFSDPLQVCDHLWLHQIKSMYMSDTQSCIKMFQNWINYLRKPYLNYKTITDTKRINFAWKYCTIILFRECRNLMDISHVMNIVSFFWAKRVPVHDLLFNDIGYAFFGEYLFRLNYSCDPNCRLFVNPSDRTGYLFAVKDIKKGEPLTICPYIPFPSRAKRAEMIHNYHLYYDCPCKKCKSSCFKKCDMISRKDHNKKVSIRFNRSTIHNHQSSSTISLSMNYGKDAHNLCKTCAYWGICDIPKYQSLSLLSKVSDFGTLLSMLADHNESNDCWCIQCYVISFNLARIHANDPNCKEVCSKFILRSSSILESWNANYFFLERMLFTEYPDSTWNDILISMKVKKRK